MAIFGWLLWQRLHAVVVLAQTIGVVQVTQVQGAAAACTAFG